MSGNDEQPSSICFSRGLPSRGMLISDYDQSMVALLVRRECSDGFELTASISRCLPDLICPKTIDSLLSRVFALDTASILNRARTSLTIVDIIILTVTSLTIRLQIREIERQSFLSFFTSLLLFLTPSLSLVSLDDWYPCSALLSGNGKSSQRRMMIRHLFENRYNLREENKNPQNGKGANATDERFTGNSLC